MAKVRRVNLHWSLERWPCRQRWSEMLLVRFFISVHLNYLPMARASTLFLANAKLLLFIAVPAFLFVAVTGPFLYPLVFGAQWYVAGQTAQIYAVAAALSFLTMPFDRSGLIVNAWWYGPGWQLGRLVTTISVLLICEMVSAPYLTFVSFLAAQSACLYAVDACASYLFSRRNTKFSGKS